ncbi:MAG: hypothetical protein QOJ29_2352 [Thermoleophilaceae bacterium]|jgi:hypothetical protein|nr:hypothetical protein [Thermoleophilaceae bacterium]
MITETPELAEALRPLRSRLGSDAPTLSELVMRGARAHLAEIEARERADTNSLATFVDRMRSAADPDLDEAHRIRHASRQP